MSRNHVGTGHCPVQNTALPCFYEKNKRILIIHDRFQFKGGGERLILILANALGADLMTEFWEPDSFDKSEFKGKNLYILAQSEYPKIVWRYFRAHFNFLFKTRNYVRNYDTIIFSGNNCLTAAINCKHGTDKILYCHSPVRHAFDLWKLNRDEQQKLWKKIIYYNIGAHGIKLIYWLGLKMMNFTITNSENIKKRLWNFSHHKTNQVIHPPIETEKFKWLEQKNYYLSFGRLERLKRIPDIVRAFQSRELGNKKLIVISGGPDLEKIKALAQGYNNIKIIGWVSDEELKDYLGNCIASIYIPIDEDFGMTPLESNAAGKPCIGVAEGGLLETIIDEKTGKLIPAKYTIQDLINAVNWMTPEKALAMREDCEKQAQKFSTERFIQEMKEVIKRNKITIGIDASRSIGSIQKTGVEKVSDGLLKSMVETRHCLVSTDVKIIYYTPKLINWLPEKNQRVLKWPFRWLWTQVRLAWELIKNPPDKFFVPVHKIPFFFLILCRDAINRVSGDAINGVSTELYILIHDIAFLKQPELYSPFQRRYLNFDLKRCVKKCKKIFVPTEQVKDDLLKYTTIDANKAVVVHHGYKTINNKQLTLQSGGQAINNRKKQILYIGRVEEKKNISNLIKAFEIFNQKYPDYELILAGSVKMDIPKNTKIKLLGYISEENKKELLQKSQCLVLVSKEEGFGFPILEAWDYQLPVLASNIPVLQEIGRGACLFVNPESPEDIAQGLEQITQNKKLQENLIKNGDKRLKKFDWQKTAKKYLEEILK